MKLTENLLHKIAIHNSVQGFFNKNIEKILENYDNVFFNSLVELQPELSEDISLFKFGVSTTPPELLSSIVSFSKVFANKIEMSNLVKQICSFSYACRYNTSEQTNSINAFYDYDKSFLADLHKYLVSNAGNYNIPTSNYLSYITLLKKDKNSFNFPEEEILGIVGKFRPEKIDQLKKVLNFHIFLLGKTESCADLMYQFVKDKIERDGAIKKLWDEKIATFPKELSNKFMSTVKFEPFKEKKAFYNSIVIDSNWLIDQFGYSQSKAQGTEQNLYMAIGSVLSTNMPQGTDIQTRNGSKLEIYTKSEGESLQVTKLINIIFDTLPSELSKANEISYSNRESLVQRLNESIKSYLFAEKLTNELSSTNLEKRKSNKI